MFVEALSLALTLASAPTPPAQATPTADHETEMATELQARSAKRCETDPRAEGETIEACAARRARALLDTYGSLPAALAATARWTATPASATGRLGFPTLDEAMAEQQARPRDAAPAQTWRPPEPRCRRETARSEDGSSVSSSIVCGTNPDAQNAARDMLERLRNPD